jgi:hypothetical protein
MSKGEEKHELAASHFVLFGGAFLANAIPHVVSGMTGRPFQSPFARPPGQGLSSSTVNVVWGVINLAVAYILICRVGDFTVSSTADAAAMGLGFLLLGLLPPATSAVFTAATLPGNEWPQTMRNKRTRPLQRNLPIKVKHGPAGDSDPLPILRAAEHTAAPGQLPGFQRLLAEALRPVRRERAV